MFGTRGESAQLSPGPQLGGQRIFRWENHRPGSATVPMPPVFGPVSFSPMQLYDRAPRASPNSPCRPRRVSAASLDAISIISSSDAICSICAIAQSVVNHQVLGGLAQLRTWEPATTTLPCGKHHIGFDCHWRLCRTTALRRCLEIRASVGVSATL